MTTFQHGTIFTIQVMDYQVQTVGNDITPLSQIQSQIRRLILLFSQKILLDFHRS